MRVTNLTFSEALDFLKQGNKLARAGWNGKNQFVIKEPGKVDSNPYFALFNAQGKWQPGWVPSTGDLLAEDWEVLM